jgi:hypothetical protein
LSSHAQGGRYPTSYTSAIGEEHFAAAKLLLRAKP